MLQLGRRGKGNMIPNVVAAGTGATPAAFYLGLCRLRGILSPPASATVILQEGRSSAQLRWCCRRAVLSCSSDDAASIPKSGPEITNQCTKEGGNGENLASIRKSEPEIKNRCTKEGVNREKLASIRKSEPEIKNRCTKEGVNRQNLASIPKSDPEIKNRCSRGVVAFCRRNHSPLPLRKLESDADLVAATTTAGGPFFSAAKKIRIGRGDSLQKAAHPPPDHPPARVPSRVADASCLGCLHGDGLDAGSTVAAKAGADAPGGGISLCFCRRGCAAPAQKPSRSTVSRNENKHKKQYLC